MQIFHPEYNRRGYKNDLALIKLTEPIDFVKYPQIGIAPLAAEEDTPFPETCFVIGMGVNETVNFTEVFEIAQFEKLTTELCVKSHGRFDEKKQVCAGQRPDDPKLGSKMTCKGDSGGPLMCLSRRGQNVGLVKQYGIISFVRGACKQTRWQPTFMPRIQFYKPWIDSVIGKH